jgi:uncharacterized protein YkwD
VTSRPFEPTRRARRIVGIVTAAAILAGLGAVPALASTYRTRALKLINAARVAHDLKPVKISIRLSGAATAHTKKMIEEDRLSDVPNLKEVLRTYDWKIGGAIVGCGGSLAAIHRAFMAEPFHHDIILLRDVRRVGIGVIRSEGKSTCGKNAFWVTEIFYG